MIHEQREDGRSVNSRRYYSALLNVDSCTGPETSVPWSGHEAPEFVASRVSPSRWSLTVDECRGRFQGRPGAESAEIHTSVSKTDPSDVALAAGASGGAKLALLIF